MVTRGLAVLLLLLGLAPEAEATARRWSAPPVVGAFDYQIGGASRPAPSVRIVDRDRHDHPAAGRYSICYVNAFQTQPEERTWWLAHHRALLLRVGGHYVEDPDWPGEYVLDTSTATKRMALTAVVRHWFAGC